jgi:2-dehydro-3-deoxyphosphogalactonate aldolase
MNGGSGPNQAEIDFRASLKNCPIIAIMRHLAPDRVVPVGEALCDAGVRLMEIPLNWDGALPALESLVKNFSGKAMIGTGTALSPDDVKRAHACGVRFVLSPNMDPEVIAATLRSGMASVPGVATPTEAFAALKQGATALKVFPGGLFSPRIVKEWRTVLPSEALVIPSGGIDADNVATYIKAGANGFGVSGALYAPSMPLDEINARAKKLIAALSLCRMDG